MPTVMRDGPYRFYFYSNEPFHEPPHIHVGEGDVVAKFWLSSVRLAANHGFASHKLTAIQSLVQQHRAELLKGWHEHLGGR